MDIITLVYNPVDRSLTTDVSDAGTAIDNLTTTLRVTGIPEGWTARLEFDVVQIVDGIPLRPYLPLVDGECVLPDYIVSATHDDGRLPVQLVMERGDERTGSKILILNVERAIGAVQYHIRYIPAVLRAFAEARALEDPVGIEFTRLNGETETVLFRVATSFGDLEGSPYDNIPLAQALNDKASLNDLAQLEDKVTANAEAITTLSGVVTSIGPTVTFDVSTRTLTVEVNGKTASAVIPDEIGETATWGKIGGYLGDQTDLVERLSAIYSNIALKADKTETQYLPVEVVTEIYGETDPSEFRLVKEARDLQLGLNPSDTVTIPEVSATVAGVMTPAKMQELTDAIDSHALDNAVVKLTTDQTVEGVKTFTSAPKVPATPADKWTDGSMEAVSVGTVKAKIDLKADQASLDALTGRVSVNETDISKKANQSALDGLAGRVGVNEADIANNTRDIATKASQSALDTLSGTVTANEKALETVAVSQDGTGATIATTAINGTTASQSITSVSGTVAGLMTPDQKQTLETAVSDISALKGRVTIYTVSLDTDTPSQELLTQLYLDRTPAPPNPPNDGTTLLDVNSDSEYVWIVSNGAWLKRAQPSTPIASDTTVGLVKGTAGTDGAVTVDSTGAMSVNGWSAVKSDIATKASQSDLNATNGAVSALTGRVETNERNIATKASQTDLDSANASVSALTEKVSANETAITGKADQSALDGLAVRVKTNEVNISNKADTSTVSALEGRVGVNETAIATKASQDGLDATNGAISALEGRVGVNETAISGKADQSALDTLAGRVSVNETAIETKAKKSDLENLSSAVDGQGMDIAQNKLDIAKKADSATVEAIAPSASFDIPSRTLTIGVNGKEATAIIPDEVGESAKWGNITGTLADQADLRDALASKLDTALAITTSGGTIQGSLEVKDVSGPIGAIPSVQIGGGDVTATGRVTAERVRIAELTPLQYNKHFGGFVVNDIKDGDLHSFSQESARSYLRVPDTTSDLTNDSGFVDGDYVTGAISGKADTSALADYATVASVDGKVATLVPRAIAEALLSTLTVEGSGTAVELVSDRVRLADGTAVQFRVPLPVANGSEAGVILPADYTAIATNTADIEALKGRSVRYVVTLNTDSPSQEYLTQVYGAIIPAPVSPPTDGTTLVDLAYNKEYTWFTTSGQWVDRGSATVNQATNTSTGIVRGVDSTTANNGKIYVENDGTMSVIGWDTLSATVANHTSEISAINTSLGNKADKSALADYVPKAGGTMTGDLTVGQAKVGANGWIQGAWLQGTAMTDLGNSDQFAVVNPQGWIYKRAKASVIKDLGINDKADASTVNALAGRVSANETAINGKAGQTDLNALDDRVTANEDALMDKADTSALSQYATNTRVDGIGPTVGVSGNTLTVTVNGKSDTATLPGGVKTVSNSISTDNKLTTTVNGISSAPVQIPIPDISGKLDKSGGTITGNLTVTGKTTSERSAIKYIQATGGDLNHANSLNGYTGVYVRRHDGYFFYRTFAEMVSDLGIDKKADKTDIPDISGKADSTTVTELDKRIKALENIPNANGVSF